MDSSSPPEPGAAPQTAQPEELKARVEGSSNTGSAPSSPVPPAAPNNKKPRHRTYHPSHKATFIGLAVVIAILGINAGALTFLLKKQAKNDNLAKNGQVTISSEQLSKLGINRTTIGGAGVDLIVAPNAQFKGNLSVAGTTRLSGELILNSKFTGTDATLLQLQAGKTQLSDLNVNGDGTISTLNLRKDLLVAGTTKIQGPVTINQLLTVVNSANVTGNLAVGGNLSVNKFSVQSLVVNGHLLSSGSTPNVGPGGAALGSNGTVSISGNDTAGTIAVNTGVGASAGTLANVAFHTQYASLPRVVVTPVGIGATIYITNLTIGGFSVAVTSGLPPGGYLINYIAIQ